MKYFKSLLMVLASIVAAGWLGTTSSNAANTSSIVTVATNNASDAFAPKISYGRGLVITHSQNPKENGTLIATFEQYTRSAPVFPIYKSTNEGGSWNRFSNVTDTQNSWGMRYQPSLYELPEKIGNLSAGTLICAGNSIPDDMSKTKIDLYASTNDGASWKYLSTVAEGGSASTTTSTDGPVWEPFITVIDHKLVCFYSDERDKPDHSQLLAHQTSNDGINWSSEVKDVADTNPSGRPGMATVAQMSNGKYIMTYEVMNDGTGRTNFKISDDGLNWNPTNLGTKLTNGGSPYVTVLSNGEIVANSYGSGNILVNDNNGIGSWKSISTGMPAAYSRSLTALPDGKLLIVSGGNFGAKANIGTSLVMSVKD